MQSNSRMIILGQENAPTRGMLLYSAPFDSIILATTIPSTMASRRRANNRGSRGRTNLDDLDGALTSMIVPQKEVKLVVDPAEERRFTMHAQNELNDASRGIFAASCQREEIDLSGFNATHTADFAKHQKDYSETKRIKP